jgi:hypothetical protein
MAGPRRKRYWTCQRVTHGNKCGTRNPSRTLKCLACGKHKPARKKPAHMAVLEQPYEWWQERFGSVCGICGAKPSARRRLDRDHCHASGAARGLLCHRCNRALPDWVTAAWLRSAAEYLERSEAQVEVEFPTLNEARAEHARAVIENQDG